MSISLSVPQHVLSNTSYGVSLRRTPNMFASMLEPSKTIKLNIIFPSHTRPWEVVSTLIINLAQAKSQDNSQSSNPHRAQRAFRIQRFKPTNIESTPKLRISSILSSEFHLPPIISYNLTGYDLEAYNAGTVKKQKF